MGNITKTERVLRQLKEQHRPESKQEIGTGMFIPNNSGDHKRGLKLDAPTLDYDLANKKYVDDSIAAIPSGTWFKTITGITNDVVADATDDTLTLASASNKLTIVGTAATDTITFTLDETKIDHANLTNLNSANYTHLTAANHTDLTDGGATTLHKHDHGGMDGLSDDDHTQYLLKQYADGTILNDAGNDAEFMIESDTEPHAFWITKTAFTGGAHIVMSKYGSGSITYPLRLLNEIGAVNNSGVGIKFSPYYSGGTPYDMGIIYSYRRGSGDYPLVFKCWNGGSTEFLRSTYDYNGIQTGEILPRTDNTYYIGKNDDDTPLAWKGIILKDQTTGTYYRLQIDNGAVNLVDLTD